MDIYLVNPIAKPKTILRPKKISSIKILKEKRKLTTATTILVYHIGSVDAKP
jgi:hypothetical protein